MYISKKKRAYFAVWPERVARRGGNEIVSDLLAFLDSVVQINPRLQNMILWSDSCVAQNRNSPMALAMKKKLWRFTLAFSRLSKNFALLGTPQFKKLTISTVTLRTFLKLS